ncbi:MAG: amino acid adenylation domain-containing protein [Bacteroidota bacterium]
MDSKLFIERLNKLDLALAMKEGHLVLKGNSNRLSPEEISAIVNNHQDISDYIKANRKHLIDYIDRSSKESILKRSDRIELMYPLSPLQEGMLFHTVLNGESGAYVNQLLADFWDLDLSNFRQSWAQVQSAHNILRTAFFYKELATPFQAVYKKAPIPLSVFDLKGFTEEQQKVQIANFLEKDRQKGFDTEQPPLMRLTIFQINQSRCRMVWTYHHVLTDGWSMSVLMSELLQGYEQLNNGQAIPVFPKDSYRDYIRFIQGIDKNRQYRFWKNYLQDIEGPTLLPFVTNEPLHNKGSRAVGKIRAAFDRENSQRIRTYGQNNHLTVNTLVQGAWAYLLSCYTQSDRVVFGVTTSGRPGELAHSEQRVGLYINTIPFYSELKATQPIEDWLDLIQQQHSEAREYQYTSLAEIKRWKDFQGELFDSLLVFENYPVEEELAKERELTIGNVVVNEHTNYLLTLAVVAGADISFELTYNSDLLSEEQVQQIARHFEQIVLQISSAQFKEVGDLYPLTEKEAHQLSTAFHGPIVDYPLEESFIHLFEQQVATQPKAKAVVFEDQMLTYAQLNGKVNGLAHQLTAAGVQKGQTVPVLMSKGLNYLVSFLGLMKLGAVVVPLAKEWPAKRLQQVLSNFDTPLLLLDKTTMELGQSLEKKTLCIDYQSMESADNPNHLIDTSQAMYIIHTSGSTGKPKGVVVAQKGILNRLHWMNDFFGKETAQAVLCTTHHVFDSAIWQICWPLINGGAAIYPAEDQIIDGPYFEQLVEREGITIADFVPSQFKWIVEFFQQKTNAPELKSLRQLILGGEAIDGTAARSFKALYPQIQLANLYGPTEASIGCVAHQLRPEDQQNIPIGRPISNVEILVLDQNQHRVPVGVAGELCIAGLCLAEGYWKEEAKTQTSFIPHPFRQGQRLYKTGDLAKWTAEGELMYLGRKDQQIKIRGYCIEPGEIEFLLTKRPEVSQALVLAQKDQAVN